MLQYTIKKLLAMLPKLLIITVLVFIGFELIPGDALSRSMDPTLYARLTEEQKEELREDYGLNDPAPVRYFNWIGNILKGDLGYSVMDKSPVGAMIKARLPATLKLAAVALVISTVLGLLLGFIAARYQNKWPDYLLTTASLVGISVPSFFFGMIFILVFAIYNPWLPSGGQPSVDDLTFFAKFRYLILPAVSMAMLDVGSLTRFTRNSMLDVMNKDYIKTGRAKGISERSVYIRHCFRNGCTPVVILLINRIPTIIAGTVVIETVYNYNGIGNLMLTAIMKADVQVAMSILLFCTVAVLIASFLCDIAVALLDPRVCLTKEEAA